MTTTAPPRTRTAALDDSLLDRHVVCDFDGCSQTAAWIALLGLREQPRRGSLLTCEPHRRALRAEVGKHIDDPDEIVQFRRLGPADGDMSALSGTLTPTTRPERNPPWTSS